jgi:hypothetical protein
MNIYYLFRKVHLPTPDWTTVKKTKFVCDALSIVAESEEHARAMASKPCPKHGRRVTKDNTLMGVAYDVEPWVWADPTMATCKMTHKDSKDLEEWVVTREFYEVERS